LFARLHLDRRGQLGRDASDQVLPGNARLGRYLDEVEAVLLQEALRGRRIPHCDRGTADRLDIAELRDACEREAMDPADCDLDRIADVETVLPGRTGVDDDLPSAVGPV